MRVIVEDYRKLLEQSMEHPLKKHLDSKDWAKIILNMLQQDLTISAEILNDNLSTFFTERQKQIIFRRAYGMELSKTEKEYYSRAIRKKLTALANPTLHRICWEISSK